MNSHSSPHNFPLDKQELSPLNQILTQYDGKDQRDSPLKENKEKAKNEKKSFTESQISKKSLAGSEYRVRRISSEKQSFGSKSKTFVEKKKEMGESYIEPSDLLPQGAETVQELIKFYEEKRNRKMRSHLDVIPKVHQDEIHCVMFSPDYRYIISGSADHSIKILDAETRQEIYHLKEAHQRTVKALAMTSNIKYLVSGSLDKFVKIYEFDTKQMIYDFQDEHPVTALAISPDNRCIIAGYQNGSLRIFNFALRQQAHHYPNVHNQSEITSLKVTPDNKFFVVLTSDGSFSVLNLLNKQKLYTFESNPHRNIKSVVITPDSNFIIAGCTLGSIKIFHILNGEQVDSLPYKPEKDMSSQNQVNQLALSADGQSLFVEYIDGHIVVWNMEIKEKIQVLQGINGSLNQIAVSQDADYLIGCSKKRSIHIIEVKAKEKNVISLQKPGQEKISIKKVALTISPDSKYILFAVDSRSITIIDSQTKQQVFTNTFTFHEIISSINVTADNKFIVVGLLDGSIKVCDFQKQELYHDFNNIQSESAARIVITPDSRYIIATSEEDSLIMLDIIEKKSVHKFHKVHNDKITCVTVTPDNKFIVTTSYDKSVKIIDLTFKKEVHHFQEAQMGEIFAVAVAPNNKFLLSASRDLSIKMFDLETKQPIHEFLFAHENSVFTISISSDSRYVVSGSGDSSVKVFDLETKQIVYSLMNLHNEHVFQVKFAPNNKYIVSLALDGGIKLINFETNMEEDIVVPPSQNMIRAMAITPDDSLVLITSEEKMHGYDIKTKQKIFSVIADNNEKIESMAISANGKFSVFGTERGSIGVFDIEKKETIRFSKGVHKENVLAITVTPDNQFIVSGSKDKSIKVIELKTGNIEKHFKDIHEDRVRTLSVTPDSRYIISGSADKSIKILDLHAKDNEKVEVYHFNDATPHFIDSIVISKDCRYLVSGSSDRSVKVFDIQTRQQVHKFKGIHKRSLTNLAITSDNTSIITASNDGSVKILKLTPVKQIPSSTNKGILTKNGLDISYNEIYYVYNGFSQYSNFNGVDDFLWNQHIPIELAYAISLRSPNLTVYPYQWNILHLAAVKGHDTFIKIMPEYSQFKVPFLLDAFNKTPLHYIIAQEKINLTSVNIMLNYICDYLEGLTRYQRYQAPEIIISLTPLFWFILTKTDIKIRVRFFNICSIPPPIPYNTELPAFGQPIADVAYFHPTIESIYESIDKIWENGEDQIEFRSSIINLDYNVLSSDMEKTIKYLSKQKNEDIFKTAYVIDLIRHLWNQTKLFLQIKFLIFSAYIIALSVYLTQEDRDEPFEIVILCCSGIFLFAEILQFLNLKQDYFKDPWNWIDMIFHPLTIAYIIARMLGTEDELARAWISTIVILFGYLRWISYLRIFKPTRNLIQVIVTVVNDMKSFIVIIALIIVGFSFIFLVFNRGRLYGFYLYNSYGSLYGPVDDGDSSDSEKFFIALIAFLLNVILLNLLISIMGDSYAKVLEKRIKTDSLTRLDMISEAATFLRFLRRNKALNRGFLVICESLEATDDDDDDDGGDNWEEKIVTLKGFFKQSDDLTEKETKRLQQDLVRIEDKRKTNEEMLQQKMNVFEAELEKTRKEQEKQGEKMNQVLSLLTEMKQKH